jgi:NTE family protein
MTRALVLGGGGPVGIAWEAGLILGLRSAGVDLGEADVVVGTSAGSVVGSYLSLGMDLGVALEQIAGAGAQQDEVLSAEQMTAVLESLMAAVAKAASSGTPEEGRAELGRLARESKTMPEEVFVDFFADLKGRPWPEGFSCTAADIDTGVFVAWDKAAGVELHRAVASSCAVPGIFPPVTIGGRRYMDGGVRSPLNADLAAGHETAVVVSVMPLTLPEGFSDPIFDQLLAEQTQELDSLRSSAGEVVVIEPSDELNEISGYGLNAMDFSRAEAALGAGLRQAETEAKRLLDTWG